MKKEKSIQLNLLYCIEAAEVSVERGVRDHIMMVLFNYEYYKALKNPNTTHIACG